MAEFNNIVVQQLDHSLGHRQVLILQRFPAFLPINVIYITNLVCNGYISHGNASAHTDLEKFGTLTSLPFTLFWYIMNVSFRKYGCYHTRSNTILCHKQLIHALSICYWYGEILCFLEFFLMFSNYILLYVDGEALSTVSTS